MVEGNKFQWPSDNKDNKENRKIVAKSSNSFGCRPHYDCTVPGRLLGKQQMETSDNRQFSRRYLRCKMVQLGRSVHQHVTPERLGSSLQDASAIASFSGSAAGFGLRRCWMLTDSVENVCLLILLACLA